MPVATDTTSEVFAARGVTRELVEQVSTVCADPQWLHERRLAAYERFEALPMPSRRDEHWRFTNLRGLDLQAIATFTGCDDYEPALARVGDAWAAAVGSGPHYVQVNSVLSEDTMRRAELPAGVIYEGLTTAAVEHEDLVRKHFGSAVSPSDSVDDKFVALNEALLAGGVFVYVPRNVKVELPLSASVVHSVDGGSVSWHALIVLEEGAEATFVEQYASTDADSSGFSNAVVELIAGAGSKLNYTTVQDYAVGVTHFATHRVLAHRDAQVEWTAVGLGASKGKTRMEARMVGAGSSVRLTGAYFLDGSQELDYDTQQFHEAPNAFSDLAFRGVLTDRAHSVWRGMIDVAEGAQGTDSYQENRNLLLSNKAHADSIPGLQIEANEVRCTHGATIGKIDTEQLFYLQSRGLSREEATRQIVRGFYVPVLDRLDERSAEWLRETLWERVDRAAAGVAQ